MAGCSVVLMHHALSVSYSKFTLIMSDSGTMTYTWTIVVYTSLFSFHLCVEPVTVTRQSHWCQHQDEACSVKRFNVTQLYNALSNAHCNQWFSKYNENSFKCCGSETLTTTPPSHMTKQLLPQSLGSLLSWAKAVTVPQIEKQLHMMHCPTWCIAVQCT